MIQNSSLPSLNSAQSPVGRDKLVYIEDNSQKNTNLREIFGKSNNNAWIPDRVSNLSEIGSNDFSKSRLSQAQSTVSMRRKMFQMRGGKLVKQDEYDDNEDTQSRISEYKRNFLKSQNSIMAEEASPQNVQKYNELKSQIEKLQKEMKKPMRKSLHHLSKLNLKQDILLDQGPESSRLPLIKEQGNEIHIEDEMVAKEKTKDVKILTIYSNQFDDKFELMQKTIDGNNIQQEDLNAQTMEQSATMYLHAHQNSDYKHYYKDGECICTYCYGIKIKDKMTNNHFQVHLNPPEIHSEYKDLYNGSTLYQGKDSQYDHQLGEEQFIGKQMLQLDSTAQRDYQVYDQYQPHHRRFVPVPDQQEMIIQTSSYKKDFFNFGAFPYEKIKDNHQLVYNSLPFPQESMYQSDFTMHQSYNPIPSIMPRGQNFLNGFFINETTNQREFFEKESGPNKKLIVLDSLISRSPSFGGQFNSEFKNQYNPPEILCPRIKEKIQSLRKLKQQYEKSVEENI